MIALLLFNLLGPVLLAIIFGILEQFNISKFEGTFFLAYIIFSPFELIPWSLISYTLIGVPSALYLGTVLRDHKNMKLHIWLFALLGFIVGALTAGTHAWYETLPKPTRVLYIGPTLAEILASNNMHIILPLGILTGAVVAFGWYYTASKALRDDARLSS